MAIPLLARLHYTQLTLVLRAWVQCLEQPDDLGGVHGGLPLQLFLNLLLVLSKQGALGRCVARLLPGLRQWLNLLQNSCRFIRNRLSMSTPSWPGHEAIVL